MELQFEKKGIGCLHTLLREEKTQEQTQEVRISDGMPDIGSVIGAWGQVILRTKQWSDGQASVNGGVMAWVLYRAEESGEVCQIESWIPFQLRWELPPAEKDGFLHLQCLLRSVDARSTSARKLMLRTNVSAMLHAMLPQQAELFVPGQLPEDIQLKTAQYPVQLPAEAGEKAFTLEETQNLPISSAKPEKLVSYTLQPEILDQKVMTDKVVFRGCGLVHILYLADDGAYYSCDVDLPFSQYAQLDSEYEEGVSCSILPCITTLEAELAEGQVKLKAGLVCQYVICREQKLELVEDAYSPHRKVQIRKELLQLPAILESKSQTVRLDAQLSAQAQRAADAVFYPELPELQRNGDTARVILPGHIQMLYYDPEGLLQCTTKHTQQVLELPLDQEASLYAQAVPTGKTQVTLGTNTQLSADLLVGLTAMAGQGLPMITALEVGEEREPDPNRPSLILRRSDGSDLWETAKAAGSTVDAIRSANGLEQDPREGQILLIPIV